MDAPREESESPPDHNENASLDDANIAQSLTRRMIGPDCLVEGVFAVEIPPGQTLHHLHVPFWPALPAAPDVECEIDGLDARVRTALAAAHGLRIEIRLPRPSDELQTGILHVSAYAAASRAAA